MPAFEVPQPLEIKMISDPSPKPSGIGDDKIADWPGAVRQLRQVAQWIVGGVIASVVAVFATSAFARLGHMNWSDDSDRLLAAIIGFVMAIGAIATIFAYGIRVIVPSGIHLNDVADAEQGTLLKARILLYKLTPELSEREYPLSKILANRDGENVSDWIEHFRRMLGFAIVKTRFDEMVSAIVIALFVAVPGMLMFVWAANPPIGYGSSPKESITIEYDENGVRSGHQVTTDQPKTEREIPETN